MPQHSRTPKQTHPRPRCPGQDQRYWKPEDIFNVACPHCGEEIEFWKDEPMHYCPACQKPVRNPRLDTGCAEWCKHAQECFAGQVLQSPKPGGKAEQEKQKEKQDKGRK